MLKENQNKSRQEINPMTNTTGTIKAIVDLELQFDFEGKLSPDEFVKKANEAVHKILDSMQFEGDSLIGLSSTELLEIDCDE